MLFRVGVVFRDIFYQYILNAALGFKYGLIKLRDERIRGLYTHYEGLQVIDEILALKQYNIAHQLSPKLVIDVGTHIGVFTTLMASKGAQVIAIEPMVINYRLLLNNVKLNVLVGKVKPIKKCIASERCAMKIGWIGQEEIVECITLNNVINEFVNNKVVDLVKMDVEGAELDILTQNNEWLDKIAHLVMEIHPNVYGIKGVKAIVESLHNRKFKCETRILTIPSYQALKRYLQTFKLQPATLLLLFLKIMIASLYREHKLSYLYCYKSTST